MVKPMPIEALALPLRFWAKVKLNSSGCLEWMGARNNLGYGHFRWEGRTRGAHRVAYQILIGAVPDGLQLDHLCRNRACVDVDHLEPVTASENVRRGLIPEIRRQQHAHVTHCPQGHAYAAPNLQITKAGHRKCRECQRLRSNVRYWENPERFRNEQAARKARNVAAHKRGSVWT